MHTLDPLAYRNAMSRFAGHVHIATAAEGDVRRGVTITAACSVSDDPATLMICLNQANPRNEIFRTNGFFALNTLAADQIDIAHVFSGRDGIDMARRFDYGTWQTLVTGAPTLANAMAVFDCKLVDIKTVATHMVLFGEVVDIRLGDDRPALIYLDRSYRTL